MAIRIIFGPVDFIGESPTTLNSTGLVISFNPTGINVREEIILEDVAFTNSYLRPDLYKVNDVEYTYRLVKNDTAISVFINDDKVVDHSLSISFSHFYYFGVPTER